jgi:flagellar biosynthesis/type III secretory pathway protein FliH
MEGRILKSAATPGAIVRHEVLDAAAEARAILDQAYAERERVTAQAREEGFREGFSQWDAAIRGAQEAAAGYARQHQQDFLRLSVRIAEKILGEALRENPERLLSVVQQALRNLSRERRLTIEVSPGQSVLLERHRASLEARLGSECSLRIVDSPDVAIGGCLLRSELGTIDARIETQLQLLERALLEDLAAAPSESAS